MPTQSTSMTGIVYWGTGSCTDYTFGLGDVTDQAFFWGACNDYSSGITIPTGQWTFVAIVYTPSVPTQITIYVNKRADTGPIQPLATADTGNLVMGADLAEGTSFTGSLDSIRVYGHALNAAEVLAVFMSSAP
jgi:Concanavalin A-like lectin/glucanases superfamily